ncbi:MAG TPA: tRNA (adenosine(37)-N6)-threonylcarbamoyltransferase complex dimerization subunit type 1 TsaB [Ignavibacteria bacterium]|nr:tRNA (adenosine(37)-N6)-threonylcarbamoyltransferase complex dimerization subunit type 1 TsaB [Ignavibacteria bacterium]
MNTLLLDSSSNTAAYAYVINGSIIFEKKLEGSRNADALMFEMKNDFQSRGIDLKEIDVVSLSNGPGSFTGLRIGSAIAKGICYAADAKLIEIPTLDIIANKHGEIPEFASVIHSGMRTGEIYYAVYKKDTVLFRISDYSIGTMDTIMQYKEIVINENVDFGENFKDVSVVNVSNKSGMRSQLELTQEKINENRFSDIWTAGPFYMQEFKPAAKGE